MSLDFNRISLLLQVADATNPAKWPKLNGLHQHVMKQLESMEIDKDGNTIVDQLRQQLADVKEAHAEEKEAHQGTRSALSSAAANLDALNGRVDELDHLDALKKENAELRTALNEARVAAAEPAESASFPKPPGGN